MAEKTLFRSALFGGYKKEDVEEYITNLENEIESIKLLHQREKNEFMRQMGEAKEADTGEQEELLKLREENARFAQELEKRREELKGQEEEYKRVKEELESQGEEYKRVKEELESQEGEYKRVKEELENQEGEYRRVKEELESQAEECKRVKEELENQAANMEAAAKEDKDSHAGPTEEELKKNEALKQENEELKRELEELHLCMAETEKKMEAMDKEKKQNFFDYQTLRKIIADANRNADQILEDAKKQKEELLSAAVEEAEKKKEAIAARIDADLEEKGIQLLAAKYKIEEYMKEVNSAQEGLFGIYNHMAEMVEAIPGRLDDIWKGEARQMIEKK